MPVIAISADDPAGCAAAAAAGPSIEIRRDPGARWIDTIAMRDTTQIARHAALPAVFVLDAAGRVRYRYLSRDAADRPTTELLLLAAEAMGRKDGDLNRW